MPRFVTSRSTALFAPLAALLLLLPAEGRPAAAAQSVSEEKKSQMPETPPWIESLPASGSPVQASAEAPSFLPVQEVPSTSLPTEESKEQPDATSAKPAIELRGRIQAETALVSQSARNEAIIGAVDDAVGFRRARLGAQGYVGEQVHWVAEFDFAGGSIAFRDVFIAAEKLPWVNMLRVGNFWEPFSLEGLTSSNYFTFIERSQSVTIDPSRHWGVGMSTFSENERFTLQAGIFRSGSGSNGNDISNENDMQYTIRLTALPWSRGTDEDPYLLHVGGAFSQQFANNNTISYNQGPQSNLLTISDNPGSAFQPTITLNATQQQLYNVQTALVLGPLSFQAEWELARIDQIQGGPVTFQGAYGFVSYFLTGEHRNYLPQEGFFGPTHVLSPFLDLKGGKLLGSGIGAWEIAARFSYMSYRDSNLPLTSTGLMQGDREADTTLGINWYLNDNTRLMFNYIHVVPVDPNAGPSYADTFFVSCQIYW
jgi:phosphate-selective porin OprO and OprP